MGPVKQTNSSAPVEFFRYFAPHTAMGFDIAQLLRMAAQDDGTREGGNSGKILTKDINGNPAETEGSQQMREAHQLDDKSSVVSVSGRPGSSGSNNHEMGHTQGEDLAVSQGSSRRSRRNKRNARQQGIEVHPDQDESYVGNVSNIDDLVKYINNDISAENLKEIDGSLKESSGTSLSPPGPVIRAKLSKRKERNKVKTSETSAVGGSSDASDTHQTSSLSEHSIEKNIQTKETVGSLDDKDRKEMGNKSSTEQLDNTKEDEAHDSSSEVIVAEPETNNKKTPKSEVAKHECGKNQKNNLVSSTKTSPNSKQKNNDDKTKVQLKVNDRDADTEDTKVKNSKKGKSKSVKKDLQKELKKTVYSPPPATPEAPIDVMGSTQEQWCTVVSKPQKKKRSQAQTSAVVQNSYTPVVAHQTRSKDFQTPSYPYSLDQHRKGQQHIALQHQSIKSQCYTLNYLRTAESERREKDLSPSDFPVLNSSPRDYRRSLENVFDIGALNSDKDSDKESSKSFPADISLVGRSRTSYPVSYASMASGNTPHESVDSSKAESVTSSVEDSGTEFSANSTSLKWKGSPQERRHSIGSAPKELSKNVLQRTGSQEMLHCDKDLRSPSVTIHSKINNPDCKNLVSSDSTGSFTSSDADSARGSEVGSEEIGEEFSTTPTDVGTKSQSGTCVEMKKTTVHAGEKMTSMNTDSEKTKTTTRSIPVESAPRSQTAKTESKVSSGAKHVNNGRKKGVVFFCNKNEECTPISGLHFGFFHEEEYASIVTNSVLNEPSVPVDEEVSQSVPVANLYSCNLSSSSQQPSVTAAAKSSSTSSDPAIKPPKGPHIAGLNGLVSPHIPDSNPVLVLQTSSNTSVFTEQTPTQLASADPGPKCSESASNLSLEASESSSEPTEKSQDKIKFAYGPKLKDKPLKYAVYLRPAEEIATSEFCQDLMMSIRYLGAGWKWNSSHWEKVKNDA